MKLAFVVFCINGLIACSNTVKLRGGTVGYGQEHSIVSAVSKQQWFMYGSLVGKNEGGALENGYIALTTHNGDNIAIHLDEKGNLVDVIISSALSPEGKPVTRYTIKTADGIYRSSNIKVVK